MQKTNNPELLWFLNLDCRVTLQKASYIEMEESKFEWIAR